MHKDGVEKLVQTLASLSSKPFSRVLDDCASYLIDNPKYALIGALTGFSSGLLGIGGG